VSNAVTKVMVNPTANIGRLSVFNRSGCCHKSKIVAANIVGMAKKKENKAAVVLENPIRSPPKMVAPDLDTPGNIASAWNIPT